MKKRYVSLALCTALAALVMTGCSANAASADTASAARPVAPAASEPAAQSTAPAASATPEATAVAPVAAPATQTTAGIAGSSAPDSGYLTEEEAKAVALDHAGLAETDLQWINARLEYEKGRAEYDVEFVRTTDTGAEEYDYELDATTGEILSYDYDAEHYNGGQAAASSTATGSAVTADQAKQIALQHAGVAEADCRAMEMETDRDHGRTTYEFSWKVGRTEYEYDIDADTGEILSFSQEEDD